MVVLAAVIVLVVKVVAAAVIISVCPGTVVMITMIYKRHSCTPLSSWLKKS